MKIDRCILLFFGMLAAFCTNAEAIISTPKVCDLQENEFERLRTDMNENSIPLVNLIVDTALVRIRRFTEGEIEIADYQRRTDATTELVRYPCLLRYRGASATQYEKRSFAVKLLDETGENLDACILGIREENSWILDAMAIDRARMRNRVCFDLWNKMSSTPYETNYGNRNGTEGVHVELFINGTYHGLYCMSDKIDRKLLALKKAEVANDSSVVVRGLLYKGVAWNERTDIHLLSYAESDVDTIAWNSWELKYPEDYPSVDTWQPLMDLIDFCSETTEDETFQHEWQEHFYLGNLIDYVVLTCALNVGDNAYKNTYLSTKDITKSRRFLLTPWDMDSSLGGLWNGGYSENFTLPYSYNSIAPYNRLYAQDMNGFRDEVKSRWSELASTILSVENVYAALDDYASLLCISGAWQREYQRWNGNPVPLKEKITEEVDYIKRWYQSNYNNLCRYFEMGTDIVQLAAEESNAVDAHLSATKKIDAIYDLSGRRVSSQFPVHSSQIQKGIYIQKGRKVVR